MTVSELMIKMITQPIETRMDINHLMKMWAYAKTIGEAEGLDVHTQFILESAAIVHDIACPVCRAKYGNAAGKLQEQESPALIEAFFADTDYAPEDIERISYLVAHHHSPESVDGIDYQIILEADYLVNADEQAVSVESIRQVEQHIFRTATGKSLLEAIFRL